MDRERSAAQRKWIVGATDAAFRHSEFFGAPSMAICEAAAPAPRGDPDVDGGTTTDRPTGGNGRRDTRRRFVEYARTRDPRLRNQLVTAHLGLAHQLARRFANRGEPYDDLVQVASMGIVFSVERFDPERGVEFSTFATRTVLGELKRHFRDKGWLVRAPRRVQELDLELKEVVGSLAQRLGRSPTVAEMAEATGSTEEAVLEAMEAEQGYRARSLDAPGDNNGPLAERLGGDDATFASVDNRAVLGPAVARLAPRDQMILRLRFEDGMSQSDIARRVGVSQMQVSRLLSASLARLRREFAESR